AERRVRPADVDHAGVGAAGGALSLGDDRGRQSPDGRRSFEADLELRAAPAGRGPAGHRAPPKARLAAADVDELEPQERQVLPPDRRAALEISPGLAEADRVRAQVVAVGARR